MTPTFDIKPLSQRKRQMVFLLAVLVFIVAVPISVFYAIGYRFDLYNKAGNIQSVGGMYIRNDVPNTAMFIDDQPVHDMRIFQKAAYIQNLSAGMHRIYVQGDGVQTWVKELPVYAHFVTEAASFNMPKVPQIRILTKWFDPVNNKGVLPTNATSTHFSFASTTNALEVSTSTATSTWIANTEYTYVTSLFASSSALAAQLAQQNKSQVKSKFSFNLSTSSSSTAIQATTTKHWRGFTLYQQGDDVYIHWDGDLSQVPHYYCVTYSGPAQTVTEYGQQVYDSLMANLGSTTDLSTKIGQQLCRSTIKIDRQDQKVLWFDFAPNSTDIVLLQLETGLYAVEVDDRSWQNSQLLYPGKDIHVIQDGGRIYVQDGPYYVEVFTEIAS